MIYFSADWHLGHKRIIGYDEVDFKDIDEYNEYVMKTFVDTIKPGDDFYFLGDFALTTDEKAEAFMKRMAATKCNMYFIKGNHDHTKGNVKLYKKYGTYLGEQYQLKSKSYHITLNHYPMRSWNRSHHGSWLIHGHEHGDAPDWGKSVDAHLLTWKKLLSMVDIVKIMEKKRTVYIGHHTGER